MKKSMWNEFFSIILIILAVILILSMLFYNYIKSTKAISAVAGDYSLPEELQEELERTIEATENQNIVKTYRVDSNDLEIYEESNDYEKGRNNPFGVPTENESNSSSRNFLHEEE